MKRLDVRREPSPSPEPRAAIAAPAGTTDVAEVVRLLGVPGAGLGS